MPNVPSTQGNGLSSTATTRIAIGCMAASVIGCFAAVESDYAKASAAALSCYGISGELAAKYSKGPGSFKENFYDEVYNLDKEKVMGRVKVEKD